MGLCLLTRCLHAPSDGFAHTLFILWPCLLEPLVDICLQYCCPRGLMGRSYHGYSELRPFKGVNLVR